MKTYFITADTHSFYNELVEELNKKGLDACTATTHKVNVLVLNEDQL